MSRLPGILVEADTLDSDDWYTPPFVFEALGLEFDLDPCAPVGGVPWVPAQSHFSEVDDGLVQPWLGRVWCNPPYSDPGPWVRRLHEHGNGVALIQCDTSTALWQDTGPLADAICFIRGRVRFVQEGDDRGWTARFASVLLAFGEDNARALRESNLGWCP
jgi:hypothetical protein